MKLGDKLGEELDSEPATGDSPGTARHGRSRHSETRLGVATEYDKQEFFPEELLETTAPKGPEESRQRLDAHMKPAFDAEPGSGTEFDKLLNVLAAEFEEFEDVKEEVLVEGFVTNATGARLEKFGTFLDTPRKTGESTARYRARLRLQLAKRRGGGTLDTVAEQVAFVLNTQRADLDIEEPWDVEAARFDMVVPQTTIDATEITIDDLRDLILDIKPAGVRPFITAAGMFTYRSEDDYLRGKNDESKAYDGLDENGVPLGVGGGYAGFIIS